MFTALQFSQLAAAAWSGPAASHHAATSHYQAPGGYSATEYWVAYHVGQATFYKSAACPFEAISAGVAAAAAAGVPVCRHHAQRTIARAAAALCGVRSLGRPGFACRARARRVARFSHA
ncbi:hypothetical protein [Hymenobacter aerophilus]|uniref:hypothetical protein n=1 Tax=Hymenobacter aerophilus TaxID=119644 RepID=UPI0012F8CD43|nr:hypothetical protein [Hymenobacter aerophilus]